jgi:hypothetical protein
MVLKLTPSEAAGQLSADVATRLSELAPLEPGLTISDGVVMKRP